MQINNSKLAVYTVSFTMKRSIKVLGIVLAVALVGILIFYLVNNEPLPKGKQGEQADALAQKMLTALNYEYYKKTEVIEWSFRNKHFYKWNKKENSVVVSWNQKKVFLKTKDPKNSIVFVGTEKVNNPELVKEAITLFNNDSFWLVAPYKIFDKGTERRIVKYNNKDALLVTYTSGGSTPGDSYLWILNNEGLPTSFKMWTSIIPLGGVEATWNDWLETEAGIKLPTKHTISLFGLELNMGNVKAYNPKANELANNILKAVKHKAYQKTRYLAWSFRDKRHFKWDKQNHIVEVSWENSKVILHPNNTLKSIVFVNGKEVTENRESLIKKAEAIFNNDSFWLVAPHKLFESGIIRTIENYQGRDVLQVKYTTGGSTPGDSYIWILDEQFLPTAYLMYVPSMNMNGVSATWQDWIITESGILLPKNHMFADGRILSMGNVKGYN